MADVFLGQIMLTGFGYAQKNFAMCNGQLLPTQQNAALFSLLGVHYGGNGTTNFALPNLMGRTPVGQGPSWAGGGNYPIGTPGGTENVTLTTQQMPAHMHIFMGTVRPGAVAAPTTPPGTWAEVTVAGGGTENVYAAPNAGTMVPLLPAAVTPAGDSQPHPNMQPFRVINFNIALSGIFPSRN